MTTVSLYDLAGWAWNEGAVGADYSIGIAGTFAGDGTITHLRWRRAATGAGRTPLALRLFDAPTQAVVATCPTVVDSGAIGWQDCPLASEFVPIPGREYRISASMPSGTIQAVKFPQANPSAPYPTAFAQSGRTYTQSSSYPYPATVEPNVQVGLDVLYVFSSGPPPDPATAADVDNSLAAWLISTSDNTHQTDGLPWLTKTVVDSIKTIADNIPQADDSKWTAAGKLWQIAGALTDAEIAAWNLFTKRSPSQLTGASGGGGSAFYTGDGRLVSGLVAQIYDATTPARSLPPGTGWTLADERDWSDSLAWAVPANCYLVSVTAYPDKQPATSSPAGTWLYRLGWWTVLDGDYSSGREWFEFAKQLLYRGGVLMPGVAIFTKGGTTGHIQAWTIG